MVIPPAKPLLFNLSHTPPFLAAKTPAINPKRWASQDTRLGVGAVDLAFTTSHYEMMVRLNQAFDLGQ